MPLFLILPITGDANTRMFLHLRWSEARSKSFIPVAGGVDSRILANRSTKQEDTIVLCDARVSVAERQSVP
jgi:hypothetical protein